MVEAFARQVGRLHAERDGATVEAFGRRGARRERRGQQQRRATDRGPLPSGSTASRVHGVSRAS